MNLQEYRNGMLDRFTGILRQDELEKISNAVICGAGSGGNGGFTYLNLARMGCLKFKIADPDIFNPVNVGSQACSNLETLGQKKVDVVAAEIKRISPKAEVEVWPDGVRVETVDEFLDGGDIVIDCIDLYELEVKKALYDTARKRNLAVISVPVLGHGAALAIFHPTKSPSFEEYFGAIPPKSDVYKYNRYIKTLAVGFFGFMPKLDWTLFMERIEEGKVPTMGTACMLSGAWAATASIDCLLGKNKIPVVPTTIHMDLMQQKLLRYGSFRRWFLKRYVQYSFWHTNSKKQTVPYDNYKSMEKEQTVGTRL